MSKQLIPLHTLIPSIDADMYVCTMAFFEAVHTEIQFSFVVTDNETQRHDDTTPKGQHDNTTMHFLTPKPLVHSTALTLI